MANNKKPTRLMTKAILCSLKNLKNAGFHIALLDEDIESTLHSAAIDGDEKVLALALMERGDVKEAIQALLEDLIYNLHNNLGDTDEWQRVMDMRQNGW